MVGITFMVFITFMGDTILALLCYSHSLLSASFPTSSSSAPAGARERGREEERPDARTALLVPDISESYVLANEMAQKYGLFHCPLSLSCPLLFERHHSLFHDFESLCAHVASAV